MTKTVYDIYSCCHHIGFTHIGFLPGVIVPVFIEFTVLNEVPNLKNYKHNVTETPP